MFNPISTYRIQFHKGFTFADFHKIIPYLHELGVKTIYASPIFQAVPGSNHGYDVTDPHCINPEIGTLKQLEDISAELKQKDMYWLQDIVPNHMAFHPDNAWLMDVLEHGRGSRFSGHFDIVWDVPEFKGRLLVPFLGSPLAEVIEKSELRVTYSARRFFLNYEGQLYPLNRASVLRVLKYGQTAPAALQSVLEQAEKENDIIKNSDKILESLCSTAGESMVDAFIAGTIKELNRNHALLRQIADEQYYQLCYWQDSEKTINYRRFFTVNGLICLNIQDEAVFNEYHSFIKELLNKQIIQGLRIDHIDGLYDPQQYLQRLRALTGEHTFIVVEKILESGEQFPEGWPVQGNTGYDFLAAVNNLYTAPASKRLFTDFYRTLTGSSKPVARAVHEKKAAILYQQMNGELENLYRFFLELKLVRADQLRQIGENNVKEAIAELLIRCPVYRYYGNKFPLPKPDAAAIRALLKEIKQFKPDLTKAANLLTRIFTVKVGGQSEAALRFYQRCMQFTGPLMAKGVEDTLMYTYDRFIAHNEVGDSPAEFGLKADQFHALMETRQACLPASINATATHDTKRGEDVRAKLNVLSDIPEVWIKMVRGWQETNEHFRKSGAPDANDEYLIYQTLVGFIHPGGQHQEHLEERISAYLNKALREAKVHTQWAKPDETYEETANYFAKKLLGPKTRFWRELMALQERINDHFILNATGQLLLKFTCPGIPDIYQGCELWDFSLVDPDNRRPVDFQARKQQLRKLRAANLAEIWEKRHDGSLKLWLTDKLLHERSAHPNLFVAGSYIPLKVTGKYRNSLIAFARRHLRDWVLVTIPLHTAALAPQPFPGFDWEDTAIILPAESPLEWGNALTGETLLISGKLMTNDLLKSFPFGLLKAAAPLNRGAGLIMHITSLPSPYGLGDLGPEAKKFTSFLCDGYQRFWQMLPVNPVSEATGYSPYSAYSSMAGNVLLVSPDKLAEQGLVNPEELLQENTENSEINFEKAIKTKHRLFDLAFERFMQTAPVKALSDFKQFKADEGSWLHDFALFEVLKSKYNKSPWYEWPGQFKLRNSAALTRFAHDHQVEIEKVKWLQHVFFKQWSEFKASANQSGVRLIGDLPFYVSYDSSDVWTKPQLFKLDNDRNMMAIAGVPPDYFNKDGQLWDMPVYNWKAMKSENYEWWIARIRRNKLLFDLLRLDHFRAFNDYWEVPAGEKVAVNGQWMPGPGIAFFNVVRRVLGEISFIAEDLGDLSPGVYDLRDKAGLPGIKVLQFAFGKDMAVSPHIPHNHTAHSVVYTGTHDNNTTLGWWSDEATLLERRHLSVYTGAPINKKTVLKFMMALCYGSTAEIAIMPMQDLLGLGSDARMNIPAAKKNNWTWQLTRDFKAAKFAGRLRTLVHLYNR